MSGYDQIHQLADVIRTSKATYVASARTADEKLPPSRNLVVCCDGTGNEFGKYNTNVVKLFGLLLKDPDRQLTYYEPGVGTLSPPSMLTRLGQALSKLWGMAFGYGITANIEDAYKFLMDNFRPGDKVFLFGFSRGAYTVRALAGMIHRCGLLPKGSDNLIRYVTKMYRQGTEELQKDFKAFFTTHNECKPYFIGVWDTVKSVSFFVQRVFKDTVMNPDIQHGRHALAIDERRGMFQPVLWTPPEDPQNQLPHQGARPQEIKQLWFAGVHSDVGGGLPSSDLSDIALRWMFTEALAQGLLPIAGWEETIKPAPKGELHNSLKPVWWLLPFHRRSVPNGDQEKSGGSTADRRRAFESVSRPVPLADYHASLAERYADFQAYKESIERPVGLLEWSRGGVPCFAVLAAFGLVLPFICWLLAVAVGSLGYAFGGACAWLADYVAHASWPLLCISGALAMLVLGLGIWAVRYLNGGD